MTTYTLQTDGICRFIVGPDRLCDAVIRTRLTDQQAQAMVDALNAMAMQPELALGEAEDPDQLTLFPS